MSTYNLENETSAIIIDLQAGRLASLIVKGQELLITEGEKLTRYGSFPMIPWCGRLDNGTLNFDGSTTQFPITSPPHANHGVSHYQKWDLVEETDNKIVISTELADPWPYGGKATQTFSLAQDSLTCEIEVAATKVAMPIMFGWHPWYKRVLENGETAKLNAKPGKRYLLNDELIPTGELGPIEGEPWNETFIDLEANPKINWEDFLNLEVSSDLDHWVIFTEPEHAMCIEPQSGPPNELNSDPQVLQPGETKTGYMKLSWS